MARRPESVARALLLLLVACGARAVPLDPDAEADNTLALIQQKMEPRRAKGLVGTQLSQDRAATAAEQALGGLFDPKAGNESQLKTVCGPQAQLYSTPASTAYFWTNKNGNSHCTGSAPYTAPSALEAGPTWSWKDETESIVSVHPCIDAEKNIYLSHRNGAVRKFNATGALLWENKDLFAGQATQVLTGGCAINEGVLYVGHNAGQVLAVDMATGATRWKSAYAGSAGGDSWSIMVNSGTVVTAGRSQDFQKTEPDFGGNDVVVALDALTGSMLWTFRPDAPVYNFIGSFVDGPPSVVFSDWTGSPYRVSLCDGALLWKNVQGANSSGVTTGGTIVSPSGDRLFVTSNQDRVGTLGEYGKVAAYRTTDGALLWSHDTDMPANNAPAIGKLQPGSDRLSVVVAVGQNPSFPDPESEERGFFPDGRAVAWSSKIIALDAVTGKTTGWEYVPEVYRKPQAYGDSFPDHICLPDSWSNAAIGGDGTVYIGHMSGRIFAFHDADGNGVLDASKGEVSSYFGSRCYQGSPGLAPGMLVATPCDGMHVFQQ